MGRFSTTVHIKNNVDRMRFVNTFSDVMKKQGFVPCSEDESAQSYLFAFGEGWVTLTSEEYKDNPQKAYDNTRDMTVALKTSAFSVEVVDSDFAIIKLSKGGKEVDTVIVGDGSGYGFEEDSPKGEKKSWEPLLADGKTWKQLSEIWNKDGVFVEDAMCESALVLGIDPKYIVEDYNDLLDMADNDENIAALYFKEKAADKKGKPMTLNTAFKKVFGEALEPLGFKLIKSKYPYFVRVVPGGEIIHIITLLNERTNEKGKKCFKIFGGIATVYRDEIDLSKNPWTENVNWMRSNANIHNATDIKYDFAYKGGFQEFLFEADNESEMLYELNHSLDVTRKVLLNIISKAVDIDSSIDFFSQIGVSLSFSERFEGLLFLKTNNYANIIVKEIKKFDDEYKQKMEQGVNGYTSEEYEKRLKRADAVLQREISPIENVLNDPKLLAKYTAELERRRAINTEKFRSYGLDIKNVDNGGTK